jgi:hypothetical protein
MTIVIPHRVMKKGTLDLDEEGNKGPTAHQVGETPSMGTSDGSTDPDDHIENIKVVLNYQGVQGSIKCKLFPTTLRKGAMSWYKNLPPESIDSWKELCRHCFPKTTKDTGHPRGHSAKI